MLSPRGRKLKLRKTMRKTMGILVIGANISTGEYRCGVRLRFDQGVDPEVTAGV